MRWEPAGNQIRSGREADCRIELIESRRAVVIDSVSRAQYRLVFVRTREAASSDPQPGRSCSNRLCGSFASGLGEFLPTNCTAVSEPLEIP